MNLNFRLHSIIKFELMGFAEPVYKIGKVKNVNATEVVIIPQMKVYRKVQDSSFPKLDLYCTADDDCDVHIRRSLISAWEYAKATDPEIHKHISENYVSSLYFPQKNFSEYTFNHYDYRTGFYKGDGNSCAYIAEES